MRNFLLFLVLAFVPLSLFSQEYNNDSRINYTAVNDTVYTEDGPMIVQKVVKKKYVRPTEFTDKWYVTAAIGPHVYFGENEWKMNTADAVTVAFELNGGRWFTPYLAADFNLNFHKFRGIYYYGGAHFRTDKIYDNYNDKNYKHTYYWQKGEYMNCYFRLLLDLTCMDGRERSTKNTHFIPFVGLGYAYGTGGTASGEASAPTFNFGLIYDVRFSNNISLNVTGRGALLFDKFDGETTSEHGFDGMVGLSFGLVYRFGKTKKVTIAPKPAPVVVAKPDSSYINEREKLEKTKQEIIGMLFPYYASFTINDTTLINREKVNLAVVAKFMNDNPKMKFVVSGYADMQTGTIERNKWLSENRAKRVVQVLVNEFMVDPKQLILESNGGVGNMFYDENKLSRCVIITIKE